MVCVATTYNYDIGIKAVTHKMEMNQHGYFPVKVYLQKQVMGAGIVAQW